METDDRGGITRREALVAAAALVGGAVLSQPTTALASTGSMQFGAVNDAGTDRTDLKSSAADNTITIQNTGLGHGLDGGNLNSASTAAGVHGFTWGQGAGVWGETAVAAASGVFAQHNGSGTALKASAGAGTGVDGYSAGGIGVYGHSNGADGVQGKCNVAGKSGVYGENPAGAGVYGSGGTVGVLGASTDGLGVKGDSTNAHGVWGLTHAAGSAGVLGSTAAASAIGVKAQNTAAGVALDVDGTSTFRGVVSFTRSGRVRIASGKASATVTVPGGLSTSANILCTAQNSPGSGVHIRNARRISATQFRVYLNKACTSSCNIAWMVLG